MRTPKTARTAIAVRIPRPATPEPLVFPPIGMVTP